MSGGGGGGGGAPHAEEHEEHEEHVNHEAWVIPYADLLTLLMALFVILFATSNLDLEKFRQLADGFKKEFNGSAGVVQGPLAGSDKVIPGGGPDPFNGVNPAKLAISEVAKATLLSQELKQAAEASEERRLGEVEQLITDRAYGAGVSELIQFRREDRGLVVTVVTDQVVFHPGSSHLEPTGQLLIDQVAAVLGEIDNDIIIEGHSDNTPISTAQFPSNYELSSSRAISVLRYMIANNGFDDKRLGATGYGDTRPIADNSTASGRAKNRRVEIVVVAEH